MGVTSSLRISVFLFCFSIFLSLLSSDVYAQNTCVWNGTTSDASTAANWTGCGGVIPQAGDIVVFQGDVAGVSTSINSDWNITDEIASLNINFGYIGTVNLNSPLNVSGDINIVTGKFKGNSSIISLKGNWNVFSGTDFDKGDIDQNGTVDMLDAGGVLLIAMDIDPIQHCSDINTDGTVDISDVILTVNIANGGQNEPCSGGVFIPGSSTAKFTGLNSQTISGNNTFNNLSKSVPGASSLIFQAESLQIIEGSLTLEGTDGGNVTLSSSYNGGLWYIEPLGTSNISYANIKDLYNVSFTNMVATNSNDQGNNYGISFGGSQCVCLPEKLELASIRLNEWRNND